MSELQFEVGKTYKIVDWDKFAKVERYRLGGKDTFTVIKVSQLLGHAYDSDNICVAKISELRSGAVVLVEDETAPRVYYIHQSGSVTYKSYVVPSADMQAWVAAVDAMNDALYGVTVGSYQVQASVNWQVGCQKIDCDTADQLYTDYVAGEWKKPVEKTYKPGQRFIEGGTKYILAAVDDEYCALINLSGGNSWDEPRPIKNSDAILLSELVDPEDIHKFKEI